MLSDEGFGCHLISYMENSYDIPGAVSLRDAGTAGIYLAPSLEENDPVVIVDALKLDAAPGTIKIYSGEELKGSLTGLRMSPHQVGLLEVLEICKLRGNAPEKLVLIGVVPQSLEVSVELSPRLHKLVPKVAVMVVDKVKALGGVKLLKRRPYHSM